MMWKPDPAIEAARKLPGWGAFHRECGKVGLFFDHPEREGRRGAWGFDAFTVEARVPRLLVTGKGATVIDALTDAHDRSGRGNPETARLLAALTAPPVADDGGFDALMGDDDSFDSFADDDGGFDALMES